MSHRNKLKEFKEAERRADIKRRLEQDEIGRSINQTRDPEFLRRELTGHLLRSSNLMQEWANRLDEVKRLGYDHKEDYAQQMVIKYSALELQALCGLATLASLPSPDSLEPADNASAPVNPSGRGKGPRGTSARS